MALWVRHVEVRVSLLEEEHLIGLIIVRRDSCGGRRSWKTGLLDNKRQTDESYGRTIVKSKMDIIVWQAPRVEIEQLPVRRERRKGGVRCA